MSGRLYTNTGKVGSVLGLLALTVGVAYCQSHADEIVDGVKSIVKKSGEIVEDVIHPGKKKVWVLIKDPVTGRIVETLPVWRNK